MKQYAEFIWIVFWVYPTYLNLGMLITNPLYLRSIGNSRWKNHYAPQLVVFFSNCGLIIYPLTNLPYDNYFIIGFDFKDQLLIFIGVYIALSLYFLFDLYLVEAIKNGNPILSSLEKLFLHFSTSHKQYPNKSIFKIKASEYAIMGTFGLMYGHKIFSYLFPNQVEYLLVSICSAIISCSFLFITRKVFSANI